MRKPSYLALGFSLIAVSLAGIKLAYDQSVREQNCLSYERQLMDGWIEADSVVARMKDIMIQVRASPFAGMGLIQPALELKSKAELVTKKINDTKYAYYETCSSKRYQDFIEKPEAVRLKSSIQNNLRQIK